jgi:hypothetical protein
MLMIDPAPLAEQLKNVDAAQKKMSDAIDALEVSAAAGSEPQRLACADALSIAGDEYDESLIDLAEAVRLALHGPDDSEDES